MAKIKGNSLRVHVITDLDKFLGNCYDPCMAELQKAAYETCSRDEYFCIASSSPVFIKKGIKEVSVIFVEKIDYTDKIRYSREEMTLVFLEGSATLRARITKLKRKYTPKAVAAALAGKTGDDWWKNG